MTDARPLAVRLRSLADCDARAGEPLGKCMREAAETLEKAEAENKRLREALEKAEAVIGPFSDKLIALRDDGDYPTFKENEWLEIGINERDLRAAADWLRQYGMG